jgi:hypothetical protein
MHFLGAFVFISFSSLQPNFLSRKYRRGRKQRERAAIQRNTHIRYLLINLERNGMIYIKKVRKQFCKDVTISMSIFSKLMYEFQVVPIKIQTGYFETVI